MDHTNGLKYDAVFGSTGQFVNNFDLDGSEGLESIKTRNVNPHKKFIYSVDHGTIVLLQAYKDGSTSS